METNLAPEEILNQPDQSESNSTRLQTALIRSCERYEDEYNQCLSSKGRRYQIFVYGQIVDCEPWAKDLANCQKWTWQSDEGAAREIIENEIQRLDDRLRPHLHNKVWKKREKPPEDWNKPLPEFMAENANTYLNLMSQRAKDPEKSKTSMCAIQ